MAAPDEELSAAFATFLRLERMEADAKQLSIDLGDMRADAARRVRELGGKL